MIGGWFTVAWLAWGAAFAVIEGVALFNSRRSDTLSEHVWAWIGVGRYSPKRRYPAASPVWTLRVARLAVATLLVWLVGHFLSGGELW